MAIITLGDQNYWREHDMEKKRYEYDLKAGDVVFDIGAYAMEFGNELLRKYPGLKIVAFEPTQAVNMFNPNIEFVNAAASVRNGTIRMGGEHNWVGEYEKDHLKNYPCVDINEWIRKHDKISLVKINVEGAEYDILLHILQAGLATRIRNFQVQFHYVEGRPSEKAYGFIASLLSKTHQLTWRVPFVWENWERK